MSYIDKKTFEVMSAGIKGILNVAQSVDNSILVKNISKEIEMLLDSVDEVTTYKDNSKMKEIKKTPKKIQQINNSMATELQEVTPTKVIRPLV